VILNCYNQAEYVAEAVESVLNQTFRDFELLIVDNGSKDDTPAIVQKYASDPRVRLFLHKENIAISSRFNEAMDAARGEFISFLYSDDYYLPHKLERQLALFERLGPDVGVVYGPSLVKNEVSGEQWTALSMQYSGFIFQHLCLHLHQGPPNMIAPMTRRRCLVENRFYDDVFAEGEAVFFRIALDYKFQFDPEPLSVARDHLRNAGKAIKVNSEIFFTCLSRIDQRTDIPKEYHSAIRIVESRKLRDVGWSSARLNVELPWARECFWKTVKMRPVGILHPKIAIGFVLTLLPRFLRSGLNRMANRVKHTRGNAVYVAGYDQ
jgi:glycosyltransferase involved in cell wall biosynthesis